MPFQTSTKPARRQSPASRAAGKPSPAQIHAGAVALATMMGTADEWRLWRGEALAVLKAARAATDPDGDE